MSFRPGDVVPLKSGGPKMTVTTVDNRGNRIVVICTWFEGTKQSTGTFALRSIATGQFGTDHRLSLVNFPLTHFKLTHYPRLTENKT